MDDYWDAHERELVKWAHDRVRRAREEREAAQRSALGDLSAIYDGYYPED